MIAIVAAITTSLVLSRSSFLVGWSIASTASCWISLKSHDPSTLDAETTGVGNAARRFRLEISHLLEQDPTLAGPLLRLAFHDATTFEPYGQKKGSANTVTTGSGGPNGSIRYEVGLAENRGIQRPLTAIENILESIHKEKEEEELDCSLSFADAVALAGATAVEASGGPHIPLRLGRKDVNQADPEFLRYPIQKATRRSFVEKTLPSAGLDSDGLRIYFSRLGFTEMEFVALSGAHGLGRHVSLLGMPKACLRNLTRDCLENAPVQLPFVRDWITLTIPTSRRCYDGMVVK